MLYDFQAFSVICISME